MKLQGEAKLVRIHFGEDDKLDGRPLYEAIVRKCRELDIAGATVYRGIEGYGASTRIHRAHLFTFSSDAPIVVTIIDSEEKINALLPHLEPMLKEGLLAVSNVEVIRYTAGEPAKPKP
jgi:PII-like signaling protein